MAAYRRVYDSCHLQADCQEPGISSGTLLSAIEYGLPFTFNSHRHARHDKTVLSVSHPLPWCELDSRQLKTVATRVIYRLTVQTLPGCLETQLTPPDTTQT